MIKTEPVEDSECYEAHMETHNILGETPSKRTGRIGFPVEYNDCIVNGKVYVQGICKYKDGTIQFMFDKDDEPKVRSRHWYAISGGKYIGASVNIDRVKKIIGLHNFIMNRIIFPGKGTTESVDHINRNGLDNRKENLRIVSQREQNLNQKQRTRRSELPADSGLTHDDIPMHVWYIKASGGHGDRFGIDMRTEGVKWKSSSSKTLSLVDKLEQAKTKLKELYEVYPYLDRQK